MSALALEVIDHTSPERAPSGQTAVDVGDVRALMQDRLAVIAGSSSRGARFRTGQIVHGVWRFGGRAGPGNKPRGGLSSSQRRQPRLSHPGGLGRIRAALLAVPRMWSVVEAHLDALG